MAQKIIKFKCKSVKRRVAGKRRIVGEKKMNSASRLRIFTICEILQVTKFRRLRKFSQPEKFSSKFCSPKTEHLQQHKTKNYEKLSLKNKKIHKIWKIKDINENPNLKIEYKTKQKYN